MPGVVVDFSLTTTVGGMSLSPTFATSGSDGTLSTSVSAGIVNSPVRVQATVRGSTVSALSDQLVISTGVADQKSFTVVPSIYNIECADHDGTDFTTVTAFVADHFNNPVPDGTAISFTTGAGAIDASCLTGLKQTTLTDGSPILQKGVPGQCTVRFICQNPRRANDRATVLAYALGEESFTDDPSILNGINRYNLGESFMDLREPFRYDRAITNLDAMSVNNGSNNGVSPALGEPFIDSDGNGLWNSSSDGFYNGVLQATPNGKTPTVHVRDSFVLVFSGSTAVISALSPEPVQLGHCIDGTPFANTPTTFNVAVRDTNATTYPGNSLAGNIMPAGTKIEFLTSNGLILSGSSFVVPNTNNPNQSAWTYPVLLQSDATQTGPGTISNGVSNPSYVCTNPVSSGLLTVKVTTPLGIISTMSFSVTD